MATKPATKPDTNCNQELSRFEQTFHRLKTPLEEFIQYDASSGLVLMGCAILALILANSPLAATYQHILHTAIGVSIGKAVLSHTLHHWINDGLMALFFFLVGLEIKREILVGELASARQAILPIGAAVGGMLLPALLYAALNIGETGAAGWAIPMATDIAFALGVVTLLGKRVPRTLSAFLLALAIVDDLGAIIVIALFYTSAINWNMLMVAAALFVLLLGCNGAGIRRPLPYFLLGGLLWLALLHSGIHATLAGVLTALTVPASARCSPSQSIAILSRLLNKFDKVRRPGQPIIGNDKASHVLQALDKGITNMASPLQRLEHRLHPWSAFGIIPLFAFVNTGIPLQPTDMLDALRHPVTLGVILGLVVGKSAGVFLAVWLLKVTGISTLPVGLNLKHMVGVALLAGIGFTMSIFIGELAFPGQVDLLLKAKTGILAASLFTGICGFFWLRLTCAYEQ